MASRREPPLIEEDRRQMASVNPERLHIRVVPYSPPRLSSDGSATALSTSRVDCFHPFLGSKSSSPSAREDFSSLSARALPISRPEQLPNLAFINNARARSAKTRTEDTDIDGKESFISPPSSPTLSTSSRRCPQMTITINPDQTFSLEPQSCPGHSVAKSSSNITRLPDAPPWPADGVTYETSAHGHPSSPLTTNGIPSLPLSNNSCATRHASDGLSRNSPWNDQFIGGLRRVLNGARGRKAETDPSPRADVEGSALTTEETCQCSPAGPVSTRESNVERILDDLPFAFDKSQPRDAFENDCEDVMSPSSSEHSLYSISRSATAENESNYMLHYRPSPSNAHSVGRQFESRAEPSRTSLLVARSPRRQQSDPAQLNGSRRRLRDSSKTLSSTSSSCISAEEATRSPFAAIVSAASPAPWSLSPRTLAFLASDERDTRSSNHRTAKLFSLRKQNTGELSSTSSFHVSQPTLRDIYRENSTYNTFVHRKSSNNNDEEGADEEIYPQRPAHCSGGDGEAMRGNTHLVCDQDEHGDGLAELALPRRPSRAMLRNYLFNVQSDRIIHSSASSRSNSLKWSYIPTWARLYYGSGEHSSLSVQCSFESLFSEYTAGSRQHPTMKAPLSTEQFTSTISQRSLQHRQSSITSASLSLEPSQAARPEARVPHASLARRVHKQTSSIWSPHLHRDKRAPLHKFWRAPSADPPRNIGFCPAKTQAALFLAGFVFPFAWMVASFISLPSKSRTKSDDKGRSLSHLDLEQSLKDSQDEDFVDCNNRARWWRNLNRYMSIFGLFIIGAAIALIVTGSQQQQRV